MPVMSHCHESHESEAGTSSTYFSASENLPEKNSDQYNDRLIEVENGENWENDDEMRCC